MATDLDAVPAEGPKAVHGVSDSGRAKELNGSWNKARMPNGRSAMRAFVAKTVDGKQIITLINHPHYAECLGMFRCQKYEYVDGK